MVLEKRAFHNLLKEVNLEQEGSFEERDFVEVSCPLVDALDNEIIMHRDSHFGGNFSIMLQYYENDGVGVNPDLDLSRIKALAKLEEGLGKNIAGEVLSASEAEFVAKSRKSYRSLREIYELKNHENKCPVLIADLILTEEEGAGKEIQAVIQEGPVMLPFLINLLRNDEFQNPLFPGYGLAPSLAAKCIGRLGDERGVAPLFEVIGKENEELEFCAIEALKRIGEPSKEFLLKVLKTPPLSRDNQNASMVLSLAFGGDERVAMECFSFLKREGRLEKMVEVFLIHACAGLKGGDREAFKIWSSSSKDLGSDVYRDLQALFKDWEEEEDTKKV